jgi:hypothetical protein
MQQTKVYRNLNKLPNFVLSIAKGGKVQGYATQHVLLSGGVSMKHATDGQQWRCKHGGARGNGCREVCQWLLAPTVSIDDTIDEIPVDLEYWNRLGCDPKIGTFTDRATGAQVDACREVFIDETGAYYR